MAEKNAYSLDELSLELQEKLMDYISHNLTRTSSFNDLHTAYGLKQPFLRLHSNPTYHITNQCFMDAMVKSGYKAKLVNKEDNKEHLNWYFNAKYLRANPT